MTCHFKIEEHQKNYNIRTTNRQHRIGNSAEESQV